jgi:integrase
VLHHPPPLGLLRARSHLIVRVEVTNAGCPNRSLLCLRKIPRRAADRLFRHPGDRLALRVTSRGTKAWTLLHGIPRRRTTLGRYPSLSLAAARARAIETKDGRGAGTVSALAEAYIRSLAKLRTAPEIERRLRRDVLPIIGHIPLAELHRRDVTRVIDAKSAPIAARRAFEDCRTMIRWAVARGDLDHSPIDGLAGPPISKPRTRALTDDEIRLLWLRLPILRSASYQQILKLCLVTGQRLGEVSGLRPSEIDLDRRVWNIPAERSKNGHPHTVSLSPLALSIIRDLPPTGVVARHISQAVQRAQPRFGLAQWTPHDLRRTALSKMAELGVPPIVIGHVANHRTTTKAGVTLGIYIQHGYEREKRDALELWASRLEGIVAGSAKVVAFHAAR